MKDLSNENIIHIKNNDIQYIQFKRLLEYQDKIVHGYTIGIDKNYRKVFRDEDNIEMRRKQSEQNYEKLCAELDIDYDKLIYSNQNHTDNIEVIEDIKDFEQENVEVDGLCTNVKGVTLSTINADCILFMFYDPVKNVIANCHSGWKGTLQRIAIKTVRKMQEHYGCDAKDIICCISPSIRKCHFEVGKDVKDLYEKEFKDIENLNETIEETITNEKWHIDTVLINKILLKRLGLLEENIIDSNLCSVCNKEQIHSYRVHGEKSGRETAIIVLKK